MIKKYINPPFHPSYLTNALLPIPWCFKQYYPELVGLGGLWATCSPQDPRFAGSNPTEVDGFFQDVKILSTSSPGETLSWGSEIEISDSLKNLKPEKIGL